MQTPMRRILMTLSCLLAAGAAHGAESAAVQRCIDQFQAEQNRIEREFRRTRPPETDRAAFERWANNLHAALNAAGRAAEACERRSQPALTPERLTTLEACMAQVAAQSEALERRYAGRTLSREEQSQLRAEQLALHERRIACDLASRR
ncbi:hypothetical protein [Hydrogenophaga sp.]|uniref:hypothetical protein n=2 Tax=Hydrogenophaga sp. TaxID=1904254 RepID=UPI002736AA37|nr:hypothetical protein [Hydrogenophaga sp.]